MKFVPQRDFPAELLIPVDGSISGKDGIFTVNINLKPFEFDGEQANQTLIIEDVPLPAASVEELSNKEFTFPTNPEDGYVETSIYIWSVHNPIDVLRMKFTNAASGTIGCLLDMKFVFEFEGACRNLEKTLVVPLKINKG
jgi:hypothetical protein